MIKIWKVLIFFLKDGTLELNKTYSWVKCNNDFRGYYVNEYSFDLFKDLINVLNTNPSVSLKRPFINANQ